MIPTLPPKKIAVYAAGWLGDNVMLDSLLQTLKQQPVEITILNPNPLFESLFTRMAAVDATPCC